MAPSTVKRLRAQLGMTQEKLAKEMGVTRGAIAQWETGAKTMRLSHAKLLKMLVAEKVVAA